MRGGSVSSQSRDAAWPRERAFIGMCDTCERDRPVVAWADEHYDYTACEECFIAQSEAWNALSPAEQEEVLRADAA